MNASMILALVIVGFIAGSLGVLSAAADFAADSVALVLGLVAVTVRDRNPAQGSDQSRATAVVAVINGVVLLAVSIVVAFEAGTRLLGTAPAVRGLPVLIVSSISALVMLAGVLVLGIASRDEDLHMRSVLIDTLADGLAAVAVAVAGGVIAIAHRWFWLDPLLAALISVVVSLAALSLLRDAARELRSAPRRT